MPTATLHRCLPLRPIGGAQRPPVQLDDNLLCLTRPAGNHAQPTLGRPQRGVFQNGIDPRHPVVSPAGIWLSVGDDKVLEGFFPLDNGGLARGRKVGQVKRATPAPREGVFPKGRHPHGRIGKLYPVNQRPHRMRPRPQVVPVPQQTEACVAMSTDTLHR